MSDEGGKVAESVWHAVVLSGLAFVFHFVWENVQCPLFFEHGSYDASLWGMTVATLGDVVLTWIIYAVAALVSREWRWTSDPWSWVQIVALVVTALALGIAVEVHALHTGRWFYKDITPVLPFLGVSIIPLLQLLILSPIVFALAERLTGRRGPSSESSTTQRRYDRIAPIYDALESIMERRRFRGWRREIWSRVEGGQVLEVGVGTGKNLPYYTPEAEITAIDISERMLERARRRAERMDVEVELAVADVQHLPHDEDSFDTVVGTFVFCSVPDPLEGLREVRRVLRPGGRLLLLEHVLSRRPILGRLMRWVDPIPFHIWGAHIDRKTVDDVEAAGFTDIESEPLALDIVKIIVAHNPG